MSRFVEKLEKVGTSSPIPMGFGAAGRDGESPDSLLLIARSTVGGLNRKAGILDSHPDAYLVDIGSSKPADLGKTAEKLGQRLWGIEAEVLDGPKARELKELGCDFVVFRDEDTGAEVLNDEELGKFIAVGLDLTEEAARAIQELPIDGVLVTLGPEMLPLTVQKLMAIQSARCLVDKPFLIAAKPELGGSELESLRNAGILGLVLNSDSRDALTRTKDAIVALPRQRSGGRRAGALAPHPTSGIDLSETDEDDDDF